MAARSEPRPVIHAAAVPPGDPVCAWCGDFEDDHRPLPGGKRRCPYDPRPFRPDPRRTLAAAFVAHLEDRGFQRLALLGVLDFPEPLAVVVEGVRHRPQIRAVSRRGLELVAEVHDAADEGQPARWSAFARWAAEAPRARAFVAVVARAQGRGGLRTLAAAARRLSPPAELVPWEPERL